MRGAAERFISDKTRLYTSALNGLKNDPSDEYIISEVIFKINFV